MSQPSARDYDRMLELATALFESLESEDAWHLIGREFAALVHADVFNRVKVDPSWSAGELLDIEPEPVARQVPPGSEVDKTIITEHPLSVHYATTGTLVPLRVSDLVSPRSWRRTAACAKMREQFGTTHALGVPLQSEPFRGLSVQLADGDFSDRDVAVATRLQPLLIAADRHLGHLDRWRATVGSPQRSDSAAAAVTSLRITPRELVVLTTLAEGLTAAGIARRLNISVRTVDKHQENLYRKLGAVDRLGAVLRAQSLGVLRAPQLDDDTDA